MQKGNTCSSLCNIKSLSSFYCHSICLYKCPCDFSWLSYDSISLKYPAWNHPESERELFDLYTLIHHLVTQDPLPRREIPACSNTKLPPRTGAQQQVTHCWELKNHSSATAFRGFSGTPLSMTRYKIISPESSTLPSNQNTFQNINLSCLSQTWSNFLSARNWRFLCRTCASKQPSFRTGNIGWHMLEYLLLSTYDFPLLKGCQKKKA